MRSKRTAEFEVLQSYPGGARLGSRAVLQVPFAPVETASGSQATYWSVQFDGILQLSLSDAVSLWDGLDYRGGCIALTYYLRSVCKNIG